MAWPSILKSLSGGVYSADGFNVQVQHDRLRLDHASVPEFWASVPLNWPIPAGPVTVPGRLDRGAATLSAEHAFDLWKWEITVRASTGQLVCHIMLDLLRTLAMLQELERQD